ncbi:LAME_0H06326g1_1 [Lachancea meyersii CBS 8951]|uniref:LAME_0H06326g1_1 n=1 Tax=Lachancea meyersii CBS 8951 TaxID=1266667 RepID=A0A1G4KEY7_9SACH|nr:LAME_0H06326g1_1 [Lachancea meyersii CBS 8951]
MLKRWLVPKLLIGLLLLFGQALANTETLVFGVPSDFEYGSAELTIDHPHLSLINTNRAIQNFDVPLDSTFKVEVQGLDAGDTYQAKFCWTAIHPVDIQMIGWSMEKQPASSNNKDLTIFVSFEVTPSSYPAFKASTVPVSVSVAAIRFGLPVDLYATFIYIALVMVATYCIYRRLNLYIW